MPDSVTKPSLATLARLFLRLGFTAFGGPAAHTAMMEDEFVKRHAWLGNKDFLDMISAINLIPGPNSTQLAIYIGFKLAGWRGLLLAGTCFILPAVWLTLLLAIAYSAYGTVPQAFSFLLGIRAAIIAVILVTAYRLSRKAIRDWTKLLILLISAALFLLHFNEIAILFGAGILMMLWTNRNRISRIPAKASSILLIPILNLGAGLPVILEHPTLQALGLTFLKIGSTLYGSGYILSAFLQRELIDNLHWLTQRQLLDAVAIGQFTPGPVLSTATFVGYLLRGIPGALTASVAIFLPSFLFVFIIGPLVPKLRASKAAAGFLDGVNAASLGLMLGVACTFGIVTLGSIAPIVIFALTLLVMLFTKTSTSWIILAAGALGWLSSLVI